MLKSKLRSVDIYSEDILFVIISVKYIIYSIFYSFNSIHT